jgi:hypothetical protein
LERLGKREDLGRKASAVIEDAVLVGVEAREKGGAAGGTKGGRDESVFKENAAPDEGVEVRGFEKGMAEDAQRVVAHVIDEDENDIAPRGVLGGAGGRGKDREYE